MIRIKASHSQWQSPANVTLIRRYLLNNISWLSAVVLHTETIHLACCALIICGVRVELPYWSGLRRTSSYRPVRSTANRALQCQNVEEVMAYSQHHGSISLLQCHTFPEHTTRVAKWCVSLVPETRIGLPFTGQMFAGASFSFIAHWTLCLHDAVWSYRKLLTSLL